MNKVKISAFLEPEFVMAVKIQSARLGVSQSQLLAVTVICPSELIILQDRMKEKLENGSYLADILKMKSEQIINSVDECNGQ